MKLIRKEQYEVIVAVKAGKYVLADMCHIIPQHLWNPDWDDEINGPAPIMKIGNIDILMFGTKHGDGVYCSNYGSEVTVDSGTIGLIAYTDIPAEWNVNVNAFSYVDIKDDSTCNNSDGVMRFENELINTKNYEEYDDDDDDYDYDYDDGEDEY